MYDASELAVHQYEAVSLDGTKVPYFLVANKKLQALTGSPHCSTGTLWLETSSWVKRKVACSRAAPLPLIAGTAASRSR